MRKGDFVQVIGNGGGTTEPHYIGHFFNITDILRITSTFYKDTKSFYCIGKSGLQQHVSKIHLKIYK